MLHIYNLFTAVDDLYEVMEEVIDLEGKWAKVLAGLRLPHRHQATIKMEHSTDAYSCLQAVLVVWLSKSYDIEKYEPPSWRTLVKAVANPIGGGDVALAKKIAVKHPGKVCMCICTCTLYMFVCIINHCLNYCSPREKWHRISSV